MRYIAFVIFTFLIINGCKKSTNSVAPPIEPILSVSQVSDSIQFTFALPKAAFGIHDTLGASFSALNQAAEPETLMISEGNVQWSLINESGRTLMSGPERYPYPLQLLILNSHQLKDIFDLHQAVIDTSGVPVIAGSYILQMLYGSMSFTLDLSLQ